MSAYRRWSILPVLLLIMGCSKQGTPPQLPDTFHLHSGWALYETGRSTAAGIQVKQISTGGPVQGLTFGSDGQLYSNGDDLMGYFDTPYYQVDSTQAGLRLRLLNKNRHSISLAGLSIQGDKIIITPPCADNCYFKFTRIYRID